MTFPPVATRGPQNARQVEGASQRGPPARPAGEFQEEKGHLERRTEEKADDNRKGEKRVGSHLATTRLSPPRPELTSPAFVLYVQTKSGSSRLRRGPASLRHAPIGFYI